MDSDRLDQILIDGIERGAAPGAVSAALDTSGVRWIGAAGETTLGTGEAMQQDTVFALHSMTKSIVSVAVLRLVELGVLDLDEPASTWCPWLAETTVFASAGSVTDLRPPASPITLRHLLTHTSGFAYAIWNAQLGEWMAATDHPRSLLERRSLHVPLMFDPGTRWEYGIGIDWAGFVIEAATGQTLGDHLHEAILDPLGMRDTTFHPDGALRERLAGRHQRLADGTLAVLEGDPPINGEFETGGGGLYGTVPDFCRFLALLLGEGNAHGVQLVSPERLRALAFTNQIGEVRVQQLRSTDLALSQHAEFFPGDPKGHSLVGQINLVPAHTGRSAGTLAWAGMANCYFWVDPAASLAGVYASRMFPFADTGSLGLAHELETAVYAGG